MRKFVFICVTILALTLGTAGIAQQPASTPQQPVAAQAGNAQQQLGLANPFPIYPIRPGVFWVEGGGGASGVIVGDTGVIVVDVKMTLTDGMRLLDDISKVSAKPIEQVILTHGDADHSGGLIAFPAPFSIIATPGCKKEIEDYVAKRAPNTPTAASLPTRLVTGVKEDVTIDGVKLQLLNFGAGHTGGDLMVYLPDQKVVFAGDILTMTRTHPLIHAELGGTSEGYVAMLKGLLSLNADIYVPGHGPSLVQRPAVQKMYDELVAERNQIKDLLAKGRTLQEIEAITGDPTQEEAHPTGRVPYFPPLAEVIYNEFTHNTTSAAASGEKR
jgi:glyoxylase-like metal-dependent hydrolase (beta-lactamase superfamily II)